jgi:hypothetical protein
VGVFSIRETGELPAKASGRLTVAARFQPSSCQFPLPRGSKPQKKAPAALAPAPAATAAAAAPAPAVPAVAAAAAVRAAEVADIVFAEHALRAGVKLEEAAAYDFAGDLPLSSPGSIVLRFRAPRERKLAR